jgi:DNA invertase Pin-like site-specific DNA recombinase
MKRKSPVNVAYADIVAAHKGGQTPTEIAADFNISTSTVYRALRQRRNEKIQHTITAPTPNLSIEIRAAHGRFSRDQITKRQR